MNNAKYNLPPKKPTKLVAQELPRTWYQRGLYDGKELRPFEGRPGAMDAYNLPSRGIG